MRNKIDSFYEVIHYIDISKESDNDVIKIVSTFESISVATLKEAEDLLDRATPSGKATFIKEQASSYAIRAYVEVINDIIIRHKIVIKKDGVICKNPNRSKSYQKHDLNEDKQVSSFIKEHSNKEKGYDNPRDKKSHNDRRNLDNIKKKSKKPHDSKSYNKKGYNGHKNKKRTKVDEIDINKLNTEDID